MKLILASGSPRREELLRTCDIQFKIVIPEVDEGIQNGEKPSGLVQRLARLKADSVADRYPDSLVLGADTIVVLDDKILGKPANPKEAYQMIKMLQGKEHSVWGGFSIVCRLKGIVVVESHETRVNMVALPDAIINEYVESGEPMDKAGAYAIQGIGSKFISKINGSYSNVVGLNVSAVAEALRKLESD